MLWPQLAEHMTAVSRPWLVRQPLLLLLLVELAVAVAAVLLLGTLQQQLVWVLLQTPVEQKVGTGRTHSG